MSEKTPTDTDTVVQTDTGNSEGRLSSISWKMATVAVFMGLIIGSLAAWATANLGIAWIAFLVGFVGGTYYLYQKPIPSSAIGSGLYATAGLLIVTPIFFYLPIIFGAEEGTAEGTGEFIGGLLGMVIWGFVFFLISIVVFGIGYFVNRRAKKKLEEMNPESV